MPLGIGLRARIGVGQVVPAIDDQDVGAAGAQGAQISDFNQRVQLL
jgi:hypothetical protein